MGDDMGPIPNLVPDDYPPDNPVVEATLQNLGGGESSDDSES